MALGEVKGIILSAGVSASHLDVPSTITRRFSRQNKGVFVRQDQACLSASILWMQTKVTNAAV